MTVAEVLRWATLAMSLASLAINLFWTLPQLRKTDAALREIEAGRRRI